MKFNRAEISIFFFTFIFISFAAGFLGGRMTMSNTFTITSEIPQKTAAPVGIIAPTVSEDPKTEFPININTAAVEDLMLLPSIGKTRAENIIKHREKNGAFRSVADIMEVSGIGPSIYDGIRDLIAVD